MKKSRELSRSLFVIKDMRAGELFTEKNVRSIRPGYGLPPKHLKNILGKKVKENIKRGTPLNWNLVRSLGTSMKPRIRRIIKPRMNTG